MPKASLSFKELDLKDLTARIGAKVIEMEWLHAPDAFELYTDPLIQELLNDPDIGEWVATRIDILRQVQTVQKMTASDASEKLIAGSFIAASIEAAEKEMKKEKKDDNTLEKK